LFGELLVLLLFGAMAARPIYHRIKAKRSEQLAAAGEAFVAQGNFSGAALKYRAALQLDPLGYRALRGAGALALRLHHSEALGIWEQVIKLPQATNSDREEEAAALLQANQLGAAAKAIDQLLKRLPSTRALLLASRYSEQVGDLDKAQEYARLAAARAPDDETAKTRLAEVLALSSAANERAQARKLLWEIAEKNSAAKKSALEALARAPDLDLTELTRIKTALTPFAAADLVDALLLADLQLRYNASPAETIYDEVEQRWGARAEVAQWLNAHQQFERVLRLTGANGTASDELRLARLDALAGERRWDEIDALLARKDLRFDPVVTESFRARVAQEKQSTLEAELHWSKAISLAGSDSSKLRFVAAFAEQSGANDAALRAFDQLARAPQQAAFALAGQERLALKQHDIASARAVAEKTLALRQEDPNARNRAAYFNLLLGKNVPANAATARELVAQFPDRLEFRVTAALGCLRLHDANAALAQFKGPPIDWGKTQPSWRAIYAAALLANEDVARAREIIQSIPPEQLSAEERTLIQLK